MKAAVRSYGLLTVTVLACLHCGGEESGSSGSTTGGTGGMAGAGGASGAAGATGGSSASGGGGTSSSVSSCPASPPSSYLGCTAGVGECSYGDQPLAECRDLWKCICMYEEPCKLQTYEDPSAQCPDPDCPATMPSASDAGASPCTTAAVGSVCAYADGAWCRCTDAGGTPEWQCGAAPTAPCPPTIPNAGTACAETDLSCWYPSAMWGWCGIAAKCTGGEWYWVADQCN